MRLTITMVLDNDAFTENGAGEVRRVLSGLAARLPNPLGSTRAGLALHDSNGNWCGRAEVESDTAEDARRELARALLDSRYPLTDAQRNAAAGLVNPI